MKRNLQNLLTPSAASALAFPVAQYNPMVKALRLDWSDYAAATVWA